MAHDFRDTQLGFTCNLQVAGDGVLRCLPPEVIDDDELAYSDPACTQPVSYREAPGDDCHPARKYVYNPDASIAYLVGATVRAPEYGFVDNHVCRQSNVDNPSHAILTAIPLSTFAAITERTE